MLIIPNFRFKVERRLDSIDFKMMCIFFYYKFINYIYFWVEGVGAQSFLVGVLKKSFLNFSYNFLKRKEKLIIFVQCMQYVVFNKYRGNNKIINKYLLWLQIFFLNRYLKIKGNFLKKIIINMIILKLRSKSFYRED